MTLTQYQIDASRTFPYLGSMELDVAHMIMGMVSEENEIAEAINNHDWVNVGEELTDIHWYLANYCRIYGITYKRFEEVTEEKNVRIDRQEIYNHITYSISKLVDLEKKLLAYKKPVSQEMRIEACINVFKALKLGYSYYNLNLSKCMENNINKLKIRFPEKFDAQLAINRDHAKERVELEK